MPDKVQKPPLGCVPASITSRARIKELADAISVYSEYFDDFTIDLMDQWAGEIQGHCNILRKDKVSKEASKNVST